MNSKDPTQLLREKIEQLHDEMKDLVLAAGISPEEYQKPTYMLPNLNEEQLAAVEGWFQGFRTGAYAKVLDIWRQRGPKYWADLEQFGEHNFPEQILLRKARGELRDAWRKQHGRPKRVKAESDESEATVG